MNFNELAKEQLLNYSTKTCVYLNGRCILLFLKCVISLKQFLILLQNDIGSNGIGTRFFNIETSERINNECSWTPAPSCERFKKEKFRSIDGSCNNFEKPNYGRAATPFQRIIGLWIFTLKRCFYKIYFLLFLIYDFWIKYEAKIFCFFHALSSQVIIFHSNDDEGFTQNGNIFLLISILNQIMITWELRPWEHVRKPPGKFDHMLS